MKITKKFFKENIGKLVKIVYQHNWRETPEDEYICSIVDTETHNGEFSIDFGHPISSNGDIFAGLIHLTSINEIKSVNEVTEEEMNLWKDKYNEFHKSILEDKGYDVCEEDMNKIHI